MSVMNESDGFKANCYICKKNYTAQGLLGGKCVCNKCYTPWYAGIEIHLEENKKLKEDNEKAALIMVEFERFIKKEKEENNKLKEELKELKEEKTNQQDYIDKLECGKVVFECAECDYKKLCMSIAAVISASDADIISLIKNN